ncbi:MAG TPA: methyl-accepting chemotaxis protein [Oligoflexus sp.]|uniref:methyl-accepting chemotaxis protein n=1 Tax=Oligoflexus sp. TaxID=1971216 RepID=UPI002D7E653F|nr:methyl-accepting chemotaxis protein [Oligoflexus sp.]HET9235751.1 methyl-accepting chemotaxis protein [Oligoflexus sp.]
MDVQNLERRRLRMVLVLVWLLYPFYCAFGSYFQLFNAKWWMIIPSSVVAMALLFLDIQGKRVLGSLPVFFFISGLLCGYQILDSAYQMKFTAADTLSIITVGASWMLGQASYRWALAFAFSFLLMIASYIYAAPAFPFERAFLLNGMVTVDVVIAVVLYIYRRSQQEMLLTRNMMNKQNQESEQQLENLRNVSASLAKGLDVFKRAIEEAMSASEEIKQTTLNNQNLSARSRDIVGRFQLQAEHASHEQSALQTAVAELEGATHDISELAEHGKADIENLQTVMAEIKGITRIVTDIVLQSKLLSFNASVEAARAGEHGRGFLVVAEEVGNLAAASDRAAKSIHRIVSDNQDQFGAMTEFLDHSLHQLRTRVEGCVTSIRSRSANVEGVFKEIVRNSSSMSDQLSDLNRAFDEIMQAIEQMARAISDVQKNSYALGDMAGKTQNSTQRIASQLQYNKDRVTILSAFTHPLDESPAETLEEEDIQAA